MPGKRIGPGDVLPGGTVPPGKLPDDPQNPKTGLSSYPNSLTTSGYTYTGFKAQVLHFLKDKFGARTTTYGGHSEGPTQSADLWTPDASFGKDSSNSPAMNNMHDYIRGNLGPLGVKYVIWKNVYYDGKNTTNQNKSGVTQGHYDHIHITFGAGPVGALKDAVGGVGEAIGGAFEGMADQVATGIAAGILRLLRYVYGKAILQPFDFASGFWWEFTKQFYERQRPYAASGEDTTGEGLEDRDIAPPGAF